MPFTVDMHFEGRSPSVREAYDSIVHAARTFGPVEEDAKKTSIHLVRNSAFAGVQTRREFLILTIKSEADRVGERIFKREQVSKNRWHLEVKLHGADSVDVELKNWLRKAYEIS